MDFCLIIQIFCRSATFKFKHILLFSKVISLTGASAPTFAALLHQMPRLKVIATVSAGYEHMSIFDKQYLADKGKE